MARGLNKFLEGIKIQDGEASQKEVAEEAIKKQLFKILIDSELQKGESKDIEQTVEQIANNLGLQENRNQITKYITQLFKSGDYEYCIDENGNIKADYSRIYMIQREDDRKGRKEAEKILQGFIQKVETYVNEMEQTKVMITDASIMHQFSEEELRRNGGWIGLAIDHVLEMRKKQETIK